MVQHSLTTHWSLQLPDLVINDGQTTSSLPETMGEELKAISRDYGPKRVKTPNMEVEQFDPLTIHRLQERQNTVLPSFGTLGITIAKPSICGYSTKSHLLHNHCPEDCLEDRRNDC